MARLLGDEADELLHALLTPETGLRVNTLRTEAAAYASNAPFELLPLPWPPEGFLVADGTARPGAHPHHDAGVFYLQDPGAMAVAALPTLPAKPRILDLAAAPGGKATHLGARMAGDGVLVANDLSPARARDLAGNLERCGVPAVVTSAAAGLLAERWGPWFDLVLLDAPCSGESMFHKSEAARRAWSPEAVSGCARRQEELLHEAVRLVRPGGLLLYSTCTLSPEENEQVLARFLVAAGDVRVEPLPEVPGSLPARPEWAGAGAPEEIAGALRLWPHRTPGAGHFVAALRVADSAAGGTYEPAGPTGANVDRTDRDRLREFLADAAPGVSLSEGALTRRGDDLFLEPQGAPPLAEVRTIRPGLPLGSLKPGRFEPAHALAMALPPGGAARELNLAADSSEAAAYLRGETLRVSGPEGWVRVGVDGYPLGWGKRSGGVVKNHYPKGLRRR